MSTPNADVAHFIAIEPCIVFGGLSSGSFETAVDFLGYCWW